MSWLDDIEKEILNKKTNQINDEDKLIFNIVKDEEKIAGLLKKEFFNATNNEISRSIDMLKEKFDRDELSWCEIIKTVRVKLED